MKISSFIQNIFKNRKNSKISSNWEEKVVIFEKRIKYKFKDKKILRKAMLHRSFPKGKNKLRISSFERMEFLGDAILGFIIAETLFREYKQKTEGELSKLKSKIVSEKYLSKSAENIGLGEVLLMSNDESKSGGRKKSSILSDAMESLICAIYFDSGFKQTMNFIKKNILNDFKSEVKQDYLINYKGKIQEYSQREFKIHPVYSVVREEGLDHDKIFVIKLSINSTINETGVGKSKKEAEQAAAKKLWEKLI